MWDFQVARHLVRMATIGSVALALWLTPMPAWAGESVVVDADGVEPRVLRVTTGERVDFVNRTGRAVHIEFTDDVRRHDVFQLPATGPIWAVFHRPGAHPYVVHVYEPKERTLRGRVDATDDPARSGGPATCGVIVLDVCLEP